MSKRFFDILSREQKETFSLLRAFSSGGVLSGGTALALQLGHRRSYDFDIFRPKPLSKIFLFQVKKHFKTIRLLVDTGDELSFISPHGIKVSFIFYPFRPLSKPIVYQGVSLSSWREIALDKAHTIGRRGEWRDYLDLYFILKKGFFLPQIIKRAQEKFGDTFSDKLFLSQLSYFGDIKDFSVELLAQEEITPEKLKTFFESEISKLAYFKK